MSRKFNEALGEKIRILRKVKGYSREELAFQASISSKFLYEIEYGQRGMSAENLKKIAKILDVSCAFLLEEEEVGQNKEESIEMFRIWKETI